MRGGGKAGAVGETLRSGPLTHCHPGFSLRFIWATKLFRANKASNHADRGNAGGAQRWLVNSLFVSPCNLHSKHSASLWGYPRGARLLILGPVGACARVAFLLVSFLWRRKEKKRAPGHHRVSKAFHIVPKALTPRQCRLILPRSGNAAYPHPFTTGILTPFPRNHAPS